MKRHFLGRDGWLTIGVLIFVTFFTLDAARTAWALPQQPFPETQKPAMVADPAAPSPTVRDPDRTPQPLTHEQKARRARAWAGLLAVSGILICGIMLVLLVLLGARRLRRMNRKPLPPQNRLPDFWYMQNAGRDGGGSLDTSPFPGTSPVPQSGPNDITRDAPLPPQRTQD